MIRHDSAATGSILAVRYTVHGADEGHAVTVIAVLQDRLNALNDLALTLNHVH